MGIIADKARYFEAIQCFEVVHYTQTSGWYDYVSCVKPDSTLFLLDDLSRPEIACMAQEKKFLQKKMLLIEGVSCRHTEVASKTIREFFVNIVRLDYDLVELNINQSYAVEWEIGLRQAGFLRPVGAFSTTLSLLVSLQEEIVYNRNWRRNLKQAHSQDLRFETIQTPAKEDVKVFLSMYKALQADKGFYFDLPENGLWALLSSPGFELCNVRDQQNKILSSIVYYTTGAEAGGLYAAKVEDSKDTGATFYMYEQLFRHLASRGYDLFDMAKLAPATHSKNSVFLFKNGIKGRYVTYLGEWSWYRKKYDRILMYFVKKYLMKKQEV